jgi:hemolysin activation/secretion protein
VLKFLPSFFEKIQINYPSFAPALPPNIDIKATNIGIDYEWNKTNYRFNPRSGNEIKLLTSAGLKTISKNNDIMSLSNNEFNYGSLYDSIKLKTYQLRIKINAAHYFPAGKAVTVKTQLNAGIYSSQTVFKNDLFQIGGYKLLRGFDEESIFATRYAVFTAELRYLAGQNSYLFAFADGGGVKTKYQSVDKNNIFISTGVGMVFETKLGLLNMSFAIGKRDDVPFDLRRAAKIHFGYINYF